MRDYISASFVEDWNRCPYKAIKTRESDIDTSTQFTQLGSLVHKVLDRFFDGDDTITDIWDDEVEKANIPDFNMYSEGLKMLRNFEIVEVNSNSQIVAREIEFLIDLEPDSKDSHCKIKGIMDRIDYLGDGIYEIIDYKTSMYVKDRWELENDLQMGIYDMAFMELWNRDDFFDKEIFPYPEGVITTIHYLRHGRHRLPERSTSDRESLKKYLITIFHQMKGMKEYPRLINKYCGYCPFRNECSSYEKVTKQNPHLLDLSTLSKEEIIQYYNILKLNNSIIEKRIDEVKDLLYGFIVDAPDGTIESDKFMVSASTKRYKSRNLNEIRHLLEPLGLYDKVLSIDNRKLEKIAKENNLETEIENITTYNFSKPILTVREKISF